MWDSLSSETVPKLKQASIEDPSKRPQKILAVGSETEERVCLGIEELDRVLGGGLVRGSLILLSGDPGIGKSTLGLQILQWVSDKGLPTLYVSGEESLVQLKMRAERLGALDPRIHVVGRSSVEELEGHIKELNPMCVVVDSVQTAYTEASNGPLGSISQLRDVTLGVMRMAKEYNVSILLIGHVTKEGMIAGPKLLEHMVDTVLYLEGENHQPVRILRVNKNRFGPTFEMAVFEMRERGLWPVSNPSLLFLKERPKGASGSVVTPHMAGSRPLLVEVQALVTKTSQPVPRRTFLGMDSQRISLILAVLEKRLGVSVGGRDVFLNVVGGIRIQETASDLAAAIAILSSYFDQPIAEEMVVFGEVGLGGEVRSVSNADLRVKEAKKLGFKTILLPRQNLLDLKEKRDLSLYGINDLREVMKMVFYRERQCRPGTEQP